MPALALAGAAGLFATALANPPPQILRLGNGPEPETLDPQRGEGVSTLNLLRDLYEGLTGFSPVGEVVPAAADRWTVSDDGLAYTFHLREDARWSNGDSVVADDFVAGLRRSVDPATGSKYAQLLSPIENAEGISRGELPPDRLGVEARDAHTLRIRLVGPAPYLPGLLAHPAAFPVHRPSLAQYGRDFARPGRLVSNGAYRLGEWVVQSQVSLLRNPYYWDNAHTAIDEVIYVPTEDLASELKRYRAGELDCTYTIPMNQARWLRGLFPGDLHIAPYIGSYWYGYNLRRAPFKDIPKLRQALSMAIDRELIAGKLLQDAVLPAYGLVAPGTAGYTPQRPPWADWPRERRVAEAQRLYAEAGYGAGHPLEVELRYNTSEDHRRIAILIAAMWKQRLGVQTRLVNEEWKVFLQNRRSRAQTEVFRGGWIADYDDAGAFLNILRSFDSQNDEAYANPAYDALLAQAQQEPDAARRRGLLQQAEGLLLADNPILPIYYYESKHLVKPWVGGWRDNPLDIHYSKDLRLLPH
ncbi:MAG: peptide ABC transporter substrate-binding protein [Nevskia sp.]|nr:peptide ABC transporter substrate-binding protein [Nevskia sp.]